MLSRRTMVFAAGMALCIVAAHVPARADGPEPAPEPAAEAAPAGDPSDGIVDLEAMVVSGAQPGPGMWKIRRGDHVLHVLGTVSPLPRRMEWMSAEVESVVAGAQVVIAPPAVVVDADVGIFRGMALLPAMLRARNNPGKRTLREVVPVDQYARWEVLKARYVGHDRGVEKRRPLLAAQELYEAALRRSGLRMGGVIEPVVRKARRAAGVPLVESTARLELEDPKAVLREFNQSDLADRECFAGAMDLIETDLETMRARANAWAVGDVEALRVLPWENHYAACQEAVTGSDLARRLGMDELPRRARETWLANVEAALAGHPSSFSMMPMHQLFGDDGVLAELAARGYEVEAP